MLLVRFERITARCRSILLPLVAGLSGSAPGLIGLVKYWGATIRDHLEHTAEAKGSHQQDLTHPFASQPAQAAIPRP